MSCKAVVFNNVTRTELDCLKADLVKGGVNVPDGDNVTIDGDFQGHHITAGVIYDEGAQSLTVTIINKPFLASCGMVTSRVHDALMVCEQAPPVPVPDPAPLPDPPVPAPLPPLVVPTPPEPVPAPPTPIPDPKPAPEPGPIPPMPAPGPPIPITADFQAGVSAERIRCAGIVDRARIKIIDLSTADLPGDILAQVLNDIHQ